LSISQVYEVGKNAAITVDMVTKEFKSQFKDEDIDKVFGADSEYDFLKRVCTVYYMFLLGLGRYSHYRYNIDTEINRYISIGLHSVLIQMMVITAKKHYSGL